MADTDTQLAFIVFEEGFEPDVREAMQRLGIAHFTRWTDCDGAGETGIREGTAVWPGLNTVIMALMPAAQVAALWEALKKARDRFPITPGIKVFVSGATMLPG